MATPHDALFKFAFGEPQHAASMLRSALPSAVAKRIEWNTLERIPISFVDEELSDRYADVLFGAQLAERPALLYFLYEHQSSSDKWMALRLLDYCVRAWTDWRRKHPDATRLPAIIPVVLHHSDKGWTHSTRFADLIDLDDQVKSDLGPHLIDFSFLLDDLARQDDAYIQQRALTELAEVVAMSFKHLPYEGDPLPVLEHLAPPDAQGDDRPHRGCPHDHSRKARTTGVCEGPGPGRSQGPSRRPSSPGPQAAHPQVRPTFPHGH